MLLPGIEVAASPTHGRGLFARTSIPRGTVVWHPCPACTVVPPGEMATLAPATFRDLDEFGYYLEQGGILLPCSNAHLMNHSCEAAVLDFGLDFAVAIRDIAAGEEVTCDYGTFCNDPQWELGCQCGSASCRRIVRPGDGIDPRLHQFWRRRLEPALEEMIRKPQLLAASLERNSRTWRALAQGGAAVPSPAFTIRNPEFLRTL